MRFHGFYCTIVFLLAISLIPAAAAPARAAEGTAEAQMLELIRQARRQPLLMAEMAGMERSAVLEAAGGRRILLENGLRPVAPNSILAKTARAHTKNMLANNYYDKTAPDGRRPATRITAAGYEALASGENLGLIGFQNFMPEETAVWEIFKNMLRDELQSGQSSPWYILNPNYSEVGISIEAGTMSFDENKSNVYLAACDFGASRTSVYGAERKLVQRINALRHEPEPRLSGANLDYGNFLYLPAPAGGLLARGAPPVKPSPALFSFARGRQADAESALRDGRLGEAGGIMANNVSRALSEDYDSAAEVWVALPVGPSAGPDEAIAKLFRHLLEAETNGGINAAGLSSLFIFNSVYRETGLSYKSISLQNSTGGTETVWGLLVCEMARPKASRHFLAGKVHRPPTGSLPAHQQPPAAFLNGLLIQVEKISRPENASPLSAISFSGPTGGYELRIPTAENNNYGYYRLSAHRLDNLSRGPLLYSDVFFYSGKQNMLKNIQLPTETLLSGP